MTVCHTAEVAICTELMQKSHQHLSLACRMESRGAWKTLRMFEAFCDLLTHQYN